MLTYIVFVGLEELSLSLKMNHRLQVFFLSRNVYGRTSSCCILISLHLFILVLLSPLSSIFELNVSENQGKRKPL